ncbi:MAG: hypothetical protein ACOYYJ_18005 [Chloroflexota bacterium]
MAKKSQKTPEELVAELSREYLKEKARSPEEIAEFTREYLESIKSEDCNRYYTTKGQWAKFNDEEIANAAPNTPDLLEPGHWTPVKKRYEVARLIKNITEDRDWYSLGIPADCVDPEPKMPNTDEYYYEDLDEDCMLEISLRDIKSRSKLFWKTLGKDGDGDADGFVRTPSGCVIPLDYVRRGLIHLDQISEESTVWLKAEAWLNKPGGIKRQDYWKNLGNLIFPSEKAFNNAPYEIMRQECLLKRFGKKDWDKAHPTEDHAYQYWKEKYGQTTADRLMKAFNEKWPDWFSPTPVVNPQGKVGDPIPKPPTETLKALDPIYIPSRIDPTLGSQGPMVPGQTFLKYQTKAPAKQQSLSTAAKTAITIAGLLFGSFLAVVTTNFEPSSPQYYEPQQPASQPQVQPPVVADPTKTRKPPTEVVYEEVVTEPPPVDNTVDRCDLFTGKQISYTFQDPSYCSTSVILNVVMSGGVPGIEYNVPGDSDSWDYWCEVEGISSSTCFYEGNDGKIHCSLNLPKSKFDSYNDISLFVNGCNWLISESSAFLESYNCEPSSTQPPVTEPPIEDRCSAAYACTPGEYVLTWSDCCQEVGGTVWTGSISQPGVCICPGASCSSDLEDVVCWSTGGEWDDANNSCSCGSGLVCKPDLGVEDCKKAGGTVELRAFGDQCVCP